MKMRVIINQNSNNMAENNQFQTGFQKSFGDKGANGFGIEKTDLTGWTGDGGTPAELHKLRSREAARLSDLQSSGAMSVTVPLNNAGIVLEGFGGAFGEGGTKPDIQGGANN
jgi:hypothetical protein